MKAKEDDVGAVEKGKPGVLFGKISTRVGNDDQDRLIKMMFLILCPIQGKAGKR